MSKNPLVIPETFTNSDITLLDDMFLQCKGVRLVMTEGLDIKSSSIETLSLFKDPKFIQEYINQLDGFHARNMIEVGIWDGGSAVFFWNLLGLDKLCCIDNKEETRQFQNYIDQEGLSDKISVHLGVDQADKDRLDVIVNDDFGEQMVDIILDDASHFYRESRATFEALFPTLREGGLYFLEDWRAGLLHRTMGLQKGKPLLHRLVHQMVDLTLIAPEIFKSAKIFNNFVVLERGPEPILADKFKLGDFLPIATK